MKSMILHTFAAAVFLLGAQGYAQTMVNGPCTYAQLQRGCYETGSRTYPNTPLCICSYFTRAELQGRCAGTALKNCAAQGNSSDSCVDYARRLCGIQ